MSKTSISIDSEELELLSFIRKDPFGIKDSRGDISDVPDVVIISAYGCIQPWAADMRFGDDNVIENTNKGSFTHIGFVKQRISGIKNKDYIQDSNGKQYIIQFIHDFKGYPQQFDLIVAEDSDE